MTADDDMAATPQVWHYGLVAHWWAEFNVDGPEIAYFQKLIERYGQPALDLACGTGRLLLPYLRAGLEVDGCDISADMLALCRAKAAREGFQPRLFQQAMHALDLPRSYRTIIVCGAFGLGGSRQHDLEALRRIYGHLQPGGVLLLDNYLPYQDRGRWPYWLSENRAKLPEAWSPPGERRRAADGTEYAMAVRLAALDPLEQLVTLEMRIERWSGGQLAAQEEYVLQERLYFRNELLVLLEQAGFRDIQVQGDYTEAEAAVEHDVLVFVAQK
jgi:SAM-dependent methyltransferase